MCHRLIERIERLDIEGYTSTTLLGEVAHLVTGFKLAPGTPQYEKFIKDGVLR